MATGEDHEVIDLAVEELHRRYAGPLLVFTNRVVGDPELAREIVNDTLVRAWRHADRYDADRSSVATWLFTIARNLAIDAQRRAGARPRVTREVTEIDLTSSDEVDRILEAWQIAEALRGLSSDHRTAIVDVHYRGASIREAAHRLGVPEGTVKSRLYYGLRALRVALEEAGVVG